METHAPGLPAGRTPSDGGLSGLGLIMQLVGGVMTAVVACYGMLFLFAMMLSGGSGGGLAGKMMLWLLVLLGISLARSIAHRSAGNRLLYDGPGTPARALVRYTEYDDAGGSASGIEQARNRLRVHIHVRVHDSPAGLDAHRS